MSADPDGEKEGGEGGDTGPRPPLGCERGPDHDVAQMPRRVRGMEEGDVVPPAAGRERVEGGPRFRTHTRRPQITIPPPRLSRRNRTSSIPAAAQSSSSRGSDTLRQNSSMLGPRKSPTSAQPREINRPAAGSPTRT